MIFEEDSRRPDWVKGRDIMLENDQEWSFPLPRMIVTLSLTDDDPIIGPDSIDTSRRFSQEYWDRVEAVRSKLASGVVVNDLDFAKCVMPLAVNLIRRNYQLSDDEVRELLRFIPGDSRNFAMWESICNVILNIGPKPDPVG